MADGPRGVFDENKKAKLLEILDYFETWKAHTDDIEKRPTEECLYDLKCSITGFIELAEISPVPHRPAYINSDLVELHFSQVRHLFNNQTPNVLQYTSVQNSIIFGQPYAFGSNKNNAGIECYPKPVCMYQK